jgi:hypothetical protein
MRPLAILPACVAVLFVLLAAYFELVLDVRAPRSALTQLTALGASASLSFDAQNQKVAQMRALYGEGVQVFLETSTGKQTVMLDGKWRVTQNHRMGQRSFIFRAEVLAVQPGGFGVTDVSGAAQGEQQLCGIVQIHLVAARRDIAAPS